MVFNLDPSLLYPPIVYQRCGEAAALCTNTTNYLDIINSYDVVGFTLTKTGNMKDMLATHDLINHMNEVSHGIHGEVAQNLVLDGAAKAVERDHIDLDQQLQDWDDEDIE